MAFRYNAGKPELHLVPIEGVADESRVFRFGAEKYNLGNWMSKPYFSRDTLIDSTLRHAFALASGEEIDEESGLGHWAHIRCNMAMYAYYKRWNLFSTGDTVVHAAKRKEAAEQAVEHRPGSSIIPEVIFNTAPFKEPILTVLQDPKAQKSIWEAYVEARTAADIEIAKAENNDENV